MLTTESYDTCSVTKSNNCDETGIILLDYNPDIQSMIFSMQPASAEHEMNEGNWGKSNRFSFVPDPFLINKLIIDYYILELLGLLKELLRGEISMLLGLAEVTVKCHMGEILARLHLHNRRDAVQYFQDIRVT